jgi:hypothetical protein
MGSLITLSIGLWDQFSEDCLALLWPVTQRVCFLPFLSIIKLENYDFGKWPQMMNKVNPKSMFGQCHPSVIVTNH